MLLSLVMCLVCVVFFTYMSLYILICGSLHITSLCISQYYCVFNACFKFFVLHCIYCSTSLYYIATLIGNLDVVDCWSF
jgi:hypothetical protein